MTPRAQNTALVAGFLAGPIAWSIDLVASYVLVPEVREDHSKLSIHVVTAVCVAIVVGGILASWRALPRERETRDERAERDERARWLAVAGLALSAFFLLMIVGQTLPKHLLWPSDMP